MFCTQKSPLILIHGSDQYIKLKFLLIFIIFFTLSPLFSQSVVSVYKNYGVNDGLPSTQVYEIIQDKKGCLWFGTDRGLVNYNGYEFKTFTIEDGLSTNVIFKLDVDVLGRVCCYGKDRKIHIFENNRFVEFKYNSVFSTLISTASNLFHFNFSQNELFFCAFDHNPEDIIYGAVNAQGELKLIKEQGIRLYDREEPVIALKYSGNLVDTIYFNDEPIGIQPISAFKTTFAAVLKDDRNFYFSTGEHLYYFENDNNQKLTLLNQFSDEILDLAVDQEGSLLIALRNLGLWKMKDRDLNSIECLISNRSIACVYIDDQNGVWASSLQNGMYYCQDKDIRRIALTDDEQIYQMIEINSRVFYVNMKGELGEIRLDEDRIDTSSFSQIAQVFFEKDEFLQRDKDFDSLWKMGVCYNADTKQYATRRLHAPYFLLDSLNFIIVNRSSISNMTCPNNELLFDFFVNCAASYKKDSLIIGTDYGLVLIHKQELTQPFNYKCDAWNKCTANWYSSPFFNSKITDIVNLGDSIYVFASAERGVFIAQPTKSNLWINHADGLISDIADRIYVKDDMLVIVTKKGISILSRAEGIVNYSSKNGLLSNNVYDVLIKKDKIWVATDQGTSVFHHQRKVERTLPIHLKAISINSVEQSLKKKYELHYNQDLIDVSFEGLSFRQEGEMRYQYKLTGVDKTWVTTENRTVRYSNLPYGTFNFIIKVQKSDKSWSTPVQLFGITRIKPFWETILFYIAVGAFFVLLFGFGFNLRLRRIRLNEKNKFQLLNLERKTLQAQMNPHFIFNSLTSLQNLIVKKDTDKANEYLGRFARLTRLALQQSTQNFILLKDEMSLLEHYVQLEQIRFPGSFTFEIQIHLEDQDIFIPPFLIQPFIENAILHGLSNKRKDGMLWLRIENHTERTLKLIIADNGSGRVDKGIDVTHKSLGIRLTKERLLLLLNTESVFIEDLIENDLPKGTQVTLLVPFKKRIDESFNH